MQEHHLETLIKNFPNLIDKKLRAMRKGRFGELNVYLRQEPLPGCDGKLDLAFVTESTVYLVEVKRDIVDANTLDQLVRYAAAVEQRYPDHKIRGYVVGMRCPRRIALEHASNAGTVKILTFGRDLPLPNKIVRCKNCKAGTSCDNAVCDCCGKPAL